MITINFAIRNYRLQSRITAGLLIGSLILALAAVGMIWNGVTLRRDGAVMDRKMQEAEASEVRIRPVLAEREQLVRDLNSMSGLLESRKFSWTRLMTSIEAVVPVGVAMKKIEFSPQERGLSLEGAAQSPEALRNLVVGLEKSASFKDPFLKHQSLEKGSISFNVVAVYREDKSAAVARAHQ